MIDTVTQPIPAAESWARAIKILLPFLAEFGFRKQVKLDLPFMLQVELLRLWRVLFLWKGWFL